MCTANQMFPSRQGVARAGGRRHSVPRGLFETYLEPYFEHLIGLIHDKKLDLPLAQSVPKTH